MTEESTPQAPNPQGNPDSQFVLQRIYLKDLSFESPLGIEAFTKTWQPKISQDINNVVKKVNDELYEVVLKLTVDASIDEQTVFLVEVHQAGLFTIKGIEGVQLAQLFNTVCPQILFPYAREVVDSCAIKGGFPALALPPINFDALFVRAIQQSQTAQAQKEAETSTTN